MRNVKFTKKWVSIWNSKIKFKYSTYMLAVLEVAEMLQEKQKSA